MDLATWIGFALTSAVLLAIPGPTVMLVASYALGRGRRSGLATVPAVTLGDATAMTLSLAGAGAVLAASASLFTALKLLGAAYLVWLGIRLWRSTPGLLDEVTAGGTGFARMFRGAYVVTALNPKSIVFFIAFVPQFVDPGRPVLGQLAILEATFLALATVNTTLWVLLVGEMRRRIAAPATLRLANRAGAACLIGAGVLTALGRRAA